MDYLILLLVATLVIIGVSALFLLGFVIDKVAGSIERAADRRQQRQYEEHEWEIHLGHDRATLLRPGTDRNDPSRELVRGASASPGIDADGLLRPSEIDVAGGVENHSQ